MLFVMILVQERLKMPIHILGLANNYKGGAILKIKALETKKYIYWPWKIRTNFMALKM